MICLWHFTILKCDTWGIPLSIDISRLSSFYVVCQAHMKLIFFFVSINCLLLNFICLLWKINDLSHCGGVICFEHITSLENVNIWGMSLRIDIRDYLVSLWHAKLKQAPFYRLIYCLLLDFVWERFSWCGFSPHVISIFCLGNRLLQVIPIVSLNDLLTIWNLKNLYPSIVLNSRFFLYAFYCEDWSCICLQSTTEW